MKVLHVCKFYAPATGGMESVVLELTRGTRRLGIDADVLCVGADRATRHEVTEDGVSVTRAGSMGKLQSTSIAPALLSLARRQIPSYDVVHVHMPDPMAALAVMLARPDAKVVVHWHSDVVRQRVALQLYRHLQRWLLSRADVIIATSQPYARSSPWLARWQHKITVIPIGISDIPPPPAETVRHIRNRYGGRRIVFALGRMTYYKGFHVLIDAAARLPDDCVVVVGGDGELLRSHRAEAAARRLSHKIVFVGRIADDELAAHFAAASLFCLPSTHRAEAYGVVLVEAMALGKPVITTDIPGSAVSWLNQEGVTGYNVPVGDSRALVTAIDGIIGHNAAAARMGEAARARYEASLTADVMVQSTVALYRTLATRGALAPLQAG
jgi:glycosyltransferase involved in cell wall biosynthesis